MTVASFYALFMQLLTEVGITVAINPVPVEFANPVPFKEDTIPCFI